MSNDILQAINFEVTEFQTLSYEQKIEKCLDALKLFGEGKHLLSVLGEMGIPVWEFTALRGTSDRLLDTYLKAKELKADILADEVVMVADTDLDPVRARVRIDARKWTAQVYNRAAYGEIYKVLKS